RSTRPRSRAFATSFPRTWTPTIFVWSGASHEDLHSPQSSARGHGARRQSAAGGTDLSIGEVHLRRCGRGGASVSRPARGLSVLPRFQFDADAVGADAGAVAGAR